MTRTIMIFPEFGNIDRIEEIRKQYDPLYGLVAPHLTLVFPFEGDIDNERLGDLLRKSLAGEGIFDLRMQGYSMQSGVFGHSLFLAVTEGGEVVQRLHEKLYDTELRVFYKGYPYVPHITIGQFESREAMEQVYNLLTEDQTEYTTQVKKVSVEMIGPSEESIILLHHELEIPMT